MAPIPARPNDGRHDDRRAPLLDENTIRFPLLGCVVDALTLDETLRRVDDVIRRGGPVQHCVVNACQGWCSRRPMTVCARSSPPARSSTPTARRSSGRARLLGVPLPERVAGIDLFVALLGVGRWRGYAVYFLGARPEVVAEVVRRAPRKRPSTCTSQAPHSGYFSGPDEKRR